MMGGDLPTGAYTLAYSTVVTSRGGSLTANELNYLTIFENSVGSDLAEFDRLWIHGLSDTIAARTSFVNPSSTMITAVNSPTFTPNVGYQGNGSTSYLNTNFTPSTQGVKYTQNSASLFVYCRTNSAVDTLEIGGIESYTAQNKSFIMVRGSSGYCFYPLNFTTALGSPSTPVTNSLGLFVSSTSSTNLKLYQNSTQITSISSTPVTTLPIPIYLLSSNYDSTPYTYSTRQISVSGAGSGVINQSNFYNAVQALGTSIGWAV